MEHEKYQRDPDMQVTRLLDRSENYSIFRTFVECLLSLQWSLPLLLNIRFLISEHEKESYEIRKSMFKSHGR